MNFLSPFKINTFPKLQVPYFLYYSIYLSFKLVELYFLMCRNLTDASIKVVAEHCPGICVLDLMNVCKLTDLSIGYLTNSCRALHTLKLCRNPFRCLFFLFSMFAFVFNYHFRFSYARHLYFLLFFFLSKSAPYRYSHFLFCTFLFLSVTTLILVGLLSLFPCCFHVLFECFILQKSKY